MKDDVRICLREKIARVRFRQQMHFVLRPRLVDQRRSEREIANAPKARKPGAWVYSPLGTAIFNHCVLLQLWHKFANKTFEHIFGFLFRFTKRLQAFRDCAGHGHVGPLLILAFQDTIADVDPRALVMRCCLCVVTNKPIVIEGVNIDQLSVATTKTSDIVKPVAFRISLPLGISATLPLQSSSLAPANSVRVGECSSPCPVPKIRSIRKSGRRARLYKVF